MGVTYRFVNQKITAHSKEYYIVGMEESFHEKCDRVLIYLNGRPSPFKEITTFKTFEAVRHVNYVTPRC
jgi:hypothetical protein